MSSPSWLVSWAMGVLGFDAGCACLFEGGRLWFVLVLAAVGAAALVHRFVVWFDRYTAPTSYFAVVFAVMALSSFSAGALAAPPPGYTDCASYGGSCSLPSDGVLIGYHDNGGGDVLRWDIGEVAAGSWPCDLDPTYSCAYRLFAGSDSAGVSPWNLTTEQGSEISAAIIGLWCIAWVLRSLRYTVSEPSSDAE